MSFSLCSTSSELAYPCSADGYRYPNLNIVLSKAFVSIGACTRRGSIGGAHTVASKKGISCHLIPGHLEGSFMGKKRLEEPRKKLEFVRTLLIDNYDSYTYNIYQELSVINGLPPVVVRNDEMTWEDIRNYLYAEGAFDNIVISPGPGTPTCPTDIGICLHLLHECWDIPILGVCLGHQALGYVHGAQIVHAHEPVHGRLSEIKHNGCFLFHAIPSGRNSGFKVVRYHSLVIDAESLPKEIIPIAWTSSSDTQSFLIPDAYESQTEHEIVDSVLSQLKNRSSWTSSNSDITSRRKILMGIMHSTRPHYGLQFHPESVATSYGRQIFKNFREITEDHWLSFHPSFTNQRKIKYTARMQVPSVSRFFGELPRSQHIVNDSDQVYQGGLGNGKFLFDAKKSSFGMFDMVNLSYPGTGGRLLKLKWRKFDHLASQIGGARNIFCNLFGDNKAENTFWLDSSSIEKGRARFSFMGGKSGPLWKQLTFRLSGQRSGCLCNMLELFNSLLYISLFPLPGER